jgi:hypothetical protein
MEDESMKIRMTLVALFLAAGAANGQGYFDFTDVPGVGERPSVQIDLNPQMLKFVSAAAGAGGEAEAADMLAGIQGIRVRVYHEVDDYDAVVEFIDSASGQLEREGWQPAVYVQDEDNRVRVYMRFDGDSVAGMTVMVAGDGEAVFINIAGSIDPVMLGNLTRQIGISGGIMQNLGGAGARPTGADSGAGDSD